MHYIIFSHIGTTIFGIQFLHFCFPLSDNPVLISRILQNPLISIFILLIEEFIQIFSLNKFEICLNLF